MRITHHTKKIEEPDDPIGSAVAALVMPDLKTRPWHVMAGVVLSVLTCFIFFVLWYGALFNRRDYWNRKALYDYLLKHPLPKPTSIGRFKTWRIGNADITLCDGEWYAYEGVEIKICSFRSGPFDKKRYKYIKELLEA